MADQTQVGMPLDEWLKLPDNAEYIDGEVILMSPATMGHARFANVLARILNNFVLPRQLGEVIVEGGFVLSESPGWVTGSRVPDVSFYAAERWNKYTRENPDWDESAFVLIPDLAVEIISANDSWKKVVNKAAKYLEDGVRLVWIIDRKSRLIHIFQPDRPEILRLTADDTLTGGDVIPGFEVKAAELFA